MLRENTAVKTHRYEDSPEIREIRNVLRFNRIQSRLARGLPPSPEEERFLKEVRDMRLEQIRVKTRNQVTLSQDDLEFLDGICRRTANLDNPIWTASRVNPIREDTIGGVDKLLDTSPEASIGNTTPVCTSGIFDYLGENYKHSSKHDLGGDLTCVDINLGVSDLGNPSRVECLMERLKTTKIIQIGSLVAANSSQLKESSFLNIQLPGSQETVDIYYRRIREIGGKKYLEFKDILGTYYLTSGTIRGGVMNLRISKIIPPTGFLKGKPTMRYQRKKIAVQILDAHPNMILI